MYRLLEDRRFYHAEEAAGRVVHFHIHTNVDPFNLRAAGAPHGLVGRPAVPPQPGREG